MSRDNDEKHGKGIDQEIRSLWFEAKYADAAIAKLWGYLHSLMDHCGVEKPQAENQYKLVKKVKVVK